MRMARFFAAASMPLLSAISSHAGIEVDFITSRGTITAVLEQDRAPKAVANLLSLANGTRAYVDPATGRVMRGAFFEHANFFEVTNTTGVKTIETGSPTNLGGDGPGYTFPDEFDPLLIHEPYVLSMVNGGPNTNGSRFCFTGNISMPARDGRNVVFGRVTKPASRAVIDAIFAAGSGATDVLSVEIRRSGTEAMAFDECAAGLPEVWPVDAPLRVIPGLSVEWLAVQPPFSILRAHQSVDLAEWSAHFRSMTGLDDPASPPSLIIDPADAPARYYHFSLTTFPGAGGVTSMSNRTLTIESPGVGTLIYQFNAAGTGGTYENIVFPGEPPFFAGNFTVSDLVPAQFEPYSFRILLFASGLGGSPYNLIRAGIDTVVPEAATGRHITLFSDELMNPVFEDEGSMELSRP
jgi:peptidyl-prolyl cis-trans isomerase A (cyclophilin A)